MKYVYLIAISFLLSCSNNSTDEKHTTAPPAPVVVDQKVEIVEDLQISPSGEVTNQFIDPVPIAPGLINAEIGNLVLSIQYNMQALGLNGLSDHITNDSVWMMGADKVTQIIFASDVKINEDRIPNGRYGLYAIPGDAEWTIILSKLARGKWAEGYDEAADLYRFKVAPYSEDQKIEYLHFDITANGDNKGRVIMEWGNLRIAFDVSSAMELK